MAGLTGWRFMANFLLPPPMVLMILLVIPFPLAMRKRILRFTSEVLSFTVFGTMKLVHFCLILSGIPLIDASVRTIRSGQIVDDTLEPHAGAMMRDKMLAKKWREERNFWLTAMAFTLWCMLTVLHATVNTLVNLEEENERLRRESDEAKGITHAEAPTSTTTQKVTGAVAGLANRLGIKSNATAIGDSPALSDDNVPAVDQGAGLGGIEMEATDGTPARTLRSRARRAD